MLSTGSQAFQGIAHITQCGWSRQSESATEQSLRSNRWLHPEYMPGSHGHYVPALSASGGERGVRFGMAGNSKFHDGCLNTLLVQKSVTVTNSWTDPEGRHVGPNFVIRLWDIDAAWFRCS